VRSQAEPANEGIPTLARKRERRDFSDDLFSPGFRLTCRASGGKKGVCLNGVTLAGAVLRSRDSLRSGAGQQKPTTQRRTDTSIRK